MEANQKRSRGFFKGKLMPFHRVPKPAATAQTRVMKANQPTACPAASVGILVHQDYAIARPKPKVSILVAGSRCDVMSQRWEEVYGMAGDESVDTKAAIYISTVQERLKLEHLNSERIPIQDNQA
ncbi:uncharacterized protein LOC129302196 [Prosopis cineraria]|uniref:uncharacterized protein LOC129302196 n=1 Tax=Prosopis cineraria TaxID=364024 RepID=UPI00240FC0DB|nr:uncharacterized protein LOC129302196 [Prosopis cineraria]